MGLFSFLRGLFWEGSYCFKCGRPLDSVNAGELFRKGWGPCTVYQCNRCSNLICEDCSLLGFGMIYGCDCGGHEFIVFQMWVMD
jgi:hypothetical protein